ncbi:hypothetical protein [Mycoplasma sp. Ms02]|uniref:hypothetical protein n=1 Tax=Mycoplasma sp. Ms02 TaxID=353851 RepID=UPI001C8A1782|nr:hypothetical protein [Mycoplasma sp. Ms02]QZE12186.1 hypothetical protein K4L35_02480 [Mycoplasma sp. Ms02]
MKKSKLKALLTLASASIISLGGLSASCQTVKNEAPSGTRESKNKLSLSVFNYREPYEIERVLQEFQISDEQKASPEYQKMMEQANSLVNIQEIQDYLNSLKTGIEEDIERTKPLKETFDAEFEKFKTENNITQENLENIQTVENEEVRQGLYVAKSKSETVNLISETLSSMLKQISNALDDISKNPEIKPEEFSKFNQQALDQYLQTTFRARAIEAGIYDDSKTDDERRQIATNTEKSLDELEPKIKFDKLFPKSKKRAQILNTIELMYLIEDDYFKTHAEKINELLKADPSFKFLNGQTITDYLKSKLNDENIFNTDQEGEVDVYEQLLNYLSFYIKYAEQTQAGFAMTTIDAFLINNDISAKSSDYIVWGSVQDVIKSKLTENGPGEEYKEKEKVWEVLGEVFYPQGDKFETIPNVNNEETEKGTYLSSWLANQNPEWNSGNVLLKQSIEISREDLYNLPIVLIHSVEIHKDKNTDPKAEKYNRVEVQAKLIHMIPSKRQLEVLSDQSRQKFNIDVYLRLSNETFKDLLDEK